MNNDVVMPAENIATKRQSHVNRHLSLKAHIYVPLESEMDWRILPMFSGS